MGTIVSQLRNERLPLRIRKTWKARRIVPATCRATRGPKANHAATSSLRWLKSAPAWWNQWGMKRSLRLSGFGIGCVS